MRKRMRQILGGVGVSIGVIIAAFTALSLEAALVYAQTSPALVNEGYVLLERGWVNDAIGIFRQAVQQYPQSVEAQLGLAIAYQRAGEDANAWNAYQRVIALDPRNQRALTAIGTLGGYRPEWQRSGINALITLLELEPQNVSVRAQRALLYGYQGQFAEAIADYELVLEANPTLETMLGAAQIYTYSGDYQRGLAWFERYLSRSASIPNSAVTAYALALQETGRPDQAVQVLSSRLASLSGLDDTAIQMRTALAIAYQRNNQLNEALATLEPLREAVARGNSTATLPLARALSTIGREEDNATLYGEAVTLYRQILETSDPAPNLLIEIADVLSEYPLSQPQALMLYEQLSSQQPDNQSLAIKRLVLANQLGQISRTELYQQVQTVLQTIPSSTAEQRLVSRALIQVDPPAPELLTTYQALAESGEVPFLYFRIAQIYMQQGDLASARNAIATYTATPIGAQDLASELLLAELDRREGNLNGSAQRYQALISSNPKPAILTNARRGLAGIRLAQG